MTGFSAQWLALREPADHRARDIALQSLVIHDLERLARMRAGPLKLVDLGSGSGSNLRALAPLLPEHQHWTLVDYDPALLQAARAACIAWADQVIENDVSLKLIKNNKHVTISFRCEDLSSNIEAVLAEPSDLITAAAFFDLVAVDWLKRFCGLLATPLYTVLTYNGIENWTPSEPNDAAMLKAFHAHQQTDKGFGAAAGPTAAGVMESLLHARGFVVSSASSPWKLDTNDHALIEQLATGSAGAVRDTGLVSQQDVDAWQRSRCQASTCEIGHTDLYARPRQF
jgi:SAM-dependent methyltransferase